MSKLSTWVTFAIFEHARGLKDLGEGMTSEDWGVFADRAEEAGADENTLIHLRNHAAGDPMIPATSCTLILGILQIGRERAWLPWPE